MNAALESRHARGQALTALVGSLSTLGPFSNDSVLPVPEPRGFASAVIGLAQSDSSAVLAGAVSHLVSGGARPLALCSLVIFVCGRTCWLSYPAGLAARLRSAQA